MGFYKKFILPKFLDWVMGSAEIEKLRPSVIGAAAGTVLEIGCGSGYNFPLYKNVTKLYALEPAKALIDLAEKRTANLPFPVYFLESGAEQIPLADQSVDAVVSTWTLCSVAEPQKVLKEISRVLKPDGCFIFIDHGRSPNKMIYLIQKILTPIFKRFSGNCHFDRDIVKLINQSGLKLKELDQFREKGKLLIYNNRGVAILDPADAFQV